MSKGTTCSLSLTDCTGALLLAAQAPLVEAEPEHGSFLA